MVLLPSLVLQLGYTAALYINKNLEEEKILLHYMVLYKPGGLWSSFWIHCFVSLLEYYNNHELLSFGESRNQFGMLYDIGEEFKEFGFQNQN